MSSRLRPASLVTASSRNLGACKGRSKKQDREWAELSRMWAQGNSVSLSSVGRGALDHNPALELSLLEARPQALELPYQSVIGFRPPPGQEGWQEGVGSSHSVQINSPGAAISHSQQLENECPSVKGTWVGHQYHLLNSRNQGQLALQSRPEL